MPDMIRVDDNESRVTNKLTIVCTCLVLEKEEGKEEIYIGPKSSKLRD